MFKTLFKGKPQILHIYLYILLGICKSVGNYANLDYVLLMFFVPIYNMINF